MGQKLLWGSLLCICMALAKPAMGAETDIGYADVGAALLDLRANPKAEELQQDDGWTLFFVSEADDRYAIWAFAPFQDPAYPAAVKRVVFMRDGALMMETRTMCQASQVACGTLLAVTLTLTGEFRDRIAEVFIENARKREHDRKARRRYQQILRDRAQSLYGRP